MAGEYIVRQKVSTFDADKNRALKLSSALKLQQEAGEEQLESCGLSYTSLFEKGMVFIVARTRMLIYRPLGLLEKFTLTTWSRGTKGMLFNRCYSFEDEAGEKCIDSQSSFVLVDPGTGRMRRPADFSSLYQLHLPDRHNSCPAPEKLHMPGEMKLAGTRKVYFSDIDYNRHMNNTVYADVVCDFIPGIGDTRVKELQINFLHEAKEGELLQIYTAKQENGWFVCAKESETLIFTAKICFF